MQHPYDVWAQGVAEGALYGVCDVRAEEPVVSNVKRIDLLIDPLPGQEAALRQRGLLGVLASSFGALEAFHDPPSNDDVDRCLIKTLSLYDRMLTAHEALPKAKRGSPPRRPRLWIVSAGDPRSVREGWGLQPWPAMLTGVYGGDGWRGPCLVVVPQLPVTRETLLLRLLGRGDVLDAAMEELHALPDDAPERAWVSPVFNLLRGALSKMGLGRYSTEEEVVMRYAEALRMHQEEMRQLREEGLQQGRQEGAAPVLRLVARKLGRPLTRDEETSVLARLDQVSDVLFDLDAPALEAWLRAPA